MKIRSTDILRTWCATAGTLVMLAALSCSKAGSASPVRASGTIEATQVDVAAQVGGVVKKLYVDEGSGVAVGDTMVALDTVDHESQLRQALAEVALAQAQVRGAEATLGSAQTDAGRADKLFSSGSATQKQKDDADSRLTLAQSQLEAARRTFDGARAARDLAQKAVANCFVTAPTKGTVTSKSVEVGDLVIPGEIVASVSELDTVDLMIYVSEVELPRVKLGAAAEVWIDASPRRPFPGTVVYISPVAEFTPKNIQTREDRVKLVFGVKIKIPNRDEMLKPGLPADAVIRPGPITGK